MPGKWERWRTERAPMWAALEAQGWPPAPPTDLARLPVWVRRFAYRGGYESIEAFAAATDEALLRIPMVGPRQLAVIRAQLAPFATPPVPLPSWVAEE
jgi:hypothetical protein